MSLRKLTEKDLELVLTWRNNPEVCRSMYNNHEISEEEHQKWFSDLEQEQQSLCYVHEDEYGKADGLIYFTQYQPEQSSAFLSFYVAPSSPAGTALKLGLDALDESFNSLSLHKINTEVLPSNERSLYLHNKLGFISEGVFRDHYFDGEVFINVIRFGLLKSEWLEKRSGINNRITKINAIAKEAYLSEERYKIVLLSDPMSWINPWLNDLVEEWQAAGHECFIFHDIDDAIPADFCFCLSLGQLVSADVRAKYKHTLVVHESDLPKGRGWSPMSWQIFEGQKSIPITLFEAEDKVDSGVIYRQEWIGLKGTELSADWRKLQGEATQSLCRYFILAYPDIVKQAKIQMGEPTFYSRRYGLDSQLNPDKTLSEQFNLLRIVDNEKFPAFFEMNGEQFILKIESTKTGVIR